MKQAQFEQTHRLRWQQFEQQLNPKSEKGDEQLQAFPAEYRFICHSLSLAKSRGYTPQLVDYLNHLMLEGHRKLYQGSGLSLLKLVHFIGQGFPRLVRRHWRAFLAAHLLFYIPTLLAYIVVQWEQSLAYDFIDAAQLANIETMYDPGNERYGRERASSSDWLMFGHYIKNNIGISFQTFASGLLAGVGSIFYLVYNGIFFGVVASHLQSLGYTHTFFSFVIGHGSFELTAIVLSGAAGLKLGFALLSPGQWWRSTALKIAASESIQLMFGVILMLLAAAFIEAFWSSMTTLAPTIKYLVGTLLWLMVYGYLIAAGRVYESR